MKRVRLAFVLALALSSLMFSTAPVRAAAVSISTFAKGYSASSLNLLNPSVEQTSDGGYIVLGYNFSIAAPLFTSPSLLRLDSTGGIIWQKTYECNSCFPTFFETPRVGQTLDGGFVLTGLVHVSQSTVNAWILKLDSAGNLAWQKTFAGMGNVTAVSADATNDGGVFVSATTLASLCCPIKAVVMKLDSTGGLVWQKSYPGFGSTITEAFSVSRTSDGGAIVAGDTSAINFIGGWLLKINSNGGVVWQKAYSETFDLLTAQQEPDGGYLASGVQPDNVPTHSGALVLRLNQTGDIMWQKSYGGGLNSATGSSSLHPSSDGGFVMVATTLTGTSDFPTLLLRADSLGKPTLLEGINPGTPSILNSAEQTTDGGFVASGQSVASLTPLSSQTLILKLDTTGQVTGCPLLFALPLSTLTLNDTTINALEVVSSGIDFGESLTNASLLSSVNTNLAPTTPCAAPSEISVKIFFTDSSLNQLPLDKKGNPSVNVTLAGGIVRSTNPGQVLAWVNVTNTSGSSLQLLKLNETLPVDWRVNPPWMPAVGAIHVYFANTTSLATDPDITQSSTINVSRGNPETVQLTISDLTTTGIGHPLMPGQSILVSIKLTYNLVRTLQPRNSYPRNYTDTALATAHSLPFSGGTSFTGSGSAFFVADAKTIG